MTSEMEPDSPVSESLAASPGQPLAGGSRRFDQPSRLSPAHLAAVTTSLRGALAQVATDLAPTLRQRPQLKWIGASEVGADAFTGNLPPLPLAVRFEVSGQPGWLAWERAAAIAAIEVALGAPGPAARAERTLTSVECAMLARMSATMIDTLGRAVGISAGSFIAAQDAESIGTWKQGGKRADPHRLLARFSFDGLGGASELALYLPCVVDRAPAAAQAGCPTALPAHLAPAVVGLTARLGASDVPLGELLELEIGDFIPLGVEVESAVTIHIEGLPRLEGSLGRAGDRLAVRVTGVAPEADRATTTEVNR